MADTHHTPSVPGKPALAAALLVMATACATPPFGPPSTPADFNGCPLIPDAATSDFLEFQTNRDAVLARMEPPTEFSLLVGLREARQERTFRRMSVFQQMSDVRLDARSGAVFVVQAPDASALERVRASMAAQTDVVAFVEENVTLYPSALEPDDPCYAIQWHYWSDEAGEQQAPGGARLPERWAATTGDADVVVAVIDTGLAANADTAAANIVDGFDFISNASNASDGDGRDNDPTDPGDAFSSFHGTHVAGTVGSVATNNSAGVAGAAWTVSVQPIRALGDLGGTTADIIDAIRWAAGVPVPGAPRNQTPADIINLSLGGGGRCSRAMQAAVDDATAAGALVIAAAGNESRDAGLTMPAGCDNVLTVAAGDFNGALARYSNFGESVELLAPGGDVRADRNRDGVPDGVASTVAEGFALYNGTSMAAPHVAGVAALILAQEPDLSPAELLARLVATARPRSARQCPQLCGAGLLNAAP